MVNSPPKVLGGFIVFYSVGKYKVGWSIPSAILVVSNPLLNSTLRISE